MEKNNAIYELRRRLDWTQAQVADYLGITKQRVSQLEHGQGTPSGPLKKMLENLQQHSEQDHS